jgi:hypothetical protein
MAISAITFVECRPRRLACRFRDGAPPLKPLLDRILPPPRRSKRARPEELVYALDDAPPLGVTLSMGVQHAALSLMFILYASMAAQGIGVEGGPISGHLHAMRRRLQPPTVQRPDWL